MPDRTIPPKFKAIETIDFPSPERHILSNGMPLYLLNMGSQPIIELELIFKSGSCYERHPGAAYFTAAMLLEGTVTKSTQDIAHIIDYYGATIGTRVQKDFCTISLSTLAKHLSPVLDLLVEILLTASFPEKSLRLLKNVKAQAIQMADKKNNQVAYKRFCTALFTAAHPYGRHLTVQDVAGIQRADLHHHYEQVLFAHGSAFVSGWVTPAALQRIKQSLEQLTPTKDLQVGLMPCSNPTEKVDLVDGQHLQSAIVIGKKLLVKKEPDFLPMVVVNTLLGGYFGSRLMRNIREDKGYTYGIHSSMVALLQAGYLAITTEVAQEVTQATIQEIYKEIEILQHEQIPEEALQNVKNYLLGHFLTTINDPFAIMQKFQAAYLHGLDQSYYATFFHQVRHITPLEIRNLAQKYLSLDTFTEVVVR
ncbi:M16 family metallopeptidase [Cardinium endosymbiont of Oedothorax gibbosus]|uniref:M16 family metallopeptidase n=1 Tax=Cardinium endosymbiont of Oedothorax gibbosus TaxID=931101 RepID=UPI002023C3B3|nr:pitrilysin family protein [Cardinium endosymbiont of Oedothorax gibbosus]CAH2559809.1 Metalloenzyme, LuxS/M16 peptidase-like superfamily protein [Cardinium endosymbiont of Oedothorax gibbosus]